MAAPDEPNVRDDADSAATIATFEVYATSEDREIDEFLIRTMRKFDSEYGRTNEEGGGVAREVRRIVRDYFPMGVRVERVRVRYGESVTITFALILTGGLALYEFVSKYDDFRKSLDRIADDVRSLIPSVGHWWRGPFPGPGMRGLIRTRATWTAGPLVRPMIASPMSPAHVPVSELVRAWRTFALFLIVLCAILFAVTIVLVWMPLSRFYDTPRATTSTTVQPGTTNP